MKSAHTPSDDELMHDWNAVGRKDAVFGGKIELFDETLRDGIQSPSVVDPPIERKLEIIELMDKLGVDMADVGLPGAGKRAVDDVTAICNYVRDQNLKLRMAAAGRTLVCDIEPIEAIQNETGVPITPYLFLGTSPVRKYAEAWDDEKLFRTTDTAISYAVKAGFEDIAFVTEDTVRSTPDVLERLFRHVISLGCRRLVLCDTVGHATPDGIRNLVDWTRALIKSTGEDVKIDWHGHNDRGLGLANALFAAEYGVDRVHGTGLGVGERVGNVSLDQLILNLKLMGAYDHDVTHLVQYCRTVSEACRVELPVNYPLAGRDAFRTATGVHAAAVIKAEAKGDAHLADVIYSGVPAGWFGREQEIEVGHMSGLSNVRYWLKKRSVAADDGLVDAIFTRAKATNRVLREDEVWDIVRRHQAAAATEG